MASSRSASSASTAFRRLASAAIWAGWFPALVDAHKARLDRANRIHEEWDDNLYLTLSLDNGFEAESKKADVVVKREIGLSRQSMNPLEGKGTLAVWDDRANQLVLYSSSQTPHLLRIGIARSSFGTTCSPIAPSVAIAASNGVSVGPGQTVLITMPSRMCSRASVFANAMSPPLHAE